MPQLRGQATALGRLLPSVWSPGRRHQPGGAAADEHSEQHARAVAVGAYFALLGPNLIAIASGGMSATDLRLLQLALLLAATAAFLLTSQWNAIPLAQSLSWPRNVTLKLVSRLALGTVAGLSAAWLLGLIFPTADAGQLAEYRNAGESIGWALLDYSVIAPILEELVFRGIVLGALRGVLSGSAALWTSSLMFASIHLTPLTIVHHTLLGLVAGHARLETRSLLLPIAIHAVYNAVVVGLSW